MRRRLIPASVFGTLGRLAVGAEDCAKCTESRQFKKTTVNTMKVENTAMFHVMIVRHRILCIQMRLG